MSIKEETVNLYRKEPFYVYRHGFAATEAYMRCWGFQVVGACASSYTGKCHGRGFIHDRCPREAPEKTYRQSDAAIRNSHGFIYGRMSRAGIRLHGRRSSFLASGIYRNITKKSGLCHARYRLGPKPLVNLFRRVCRPIATPETPGAFLFGLRLMAVDGTVEDIPDTPANSAAFGRQTGSRGDSAFPQLRNVYLVESGTHVVCDAIVRGYQFDERTAALRLLRSVDQSMLLMWDRGFHGFSMVRACQNKCHFLGRLPANAIFEPLETFSDGSFIAEIYETQADRKSKKKGIRVRIVEYTIDDPMRNGHQEKHRLITSLLDPEQAPAYTLAVEYHQRWEIEITIDEIDTHQRVHSNRPLRSKKPVGVIQEMYGILLAHYIVRFFINEAAAYQQIDPDRISFVRSLRIIRRKIDKFQIAAPERRNKLYVAMLKEIADQKLPPRDNRSNPRVVKRKISKFKLKRNIHRNIHHSHKPFTESVVMLN